MGFYNKKRNKNKKHTIDNYVPPFDAAVMQQDLTPLRLRENTLALLTGAEITTLLALCKKTEKDLYKIKTFNKKNLMDVKYGLEKNKLFLKPMEEQASPKEDGERETKSDNNNQKRPQQKPQIKQQTPPQQRFDDISEAKTKKERERLRPKRSVVEDVKDIYVKINKNGLWGFADRATGKEVISPVYDDVFSYKEELCCVEKDEKFGYINRQGEFCIELIYDGASSFSEGYACVFKGENCGYIDKEGALIVDFNYDAGTPFEDGGCRVKKNGQWGELTISENGKPEIRWIV